MIKTKKQMFTLIGAFLLVIMLGTITYAFFNYTRTGTANAIRTGRIAFNSSQGTAINLTNMFPIDVSDGIPNDATKVGTVTINVTGDTTYTEGLEYLVSAVNVTNTVGSKSLPISIDVAVSNNTNNDPATTLGTNDADYFTDRGGDTSYYKVLASETINTDDQLVVGYIAPGSIGVDGNLVIRAYLDASKIAITDTYDGNETDNMGTATNWVDDRTIFTTTEWNSLQQNGVSFQIKVESNEGIWVDDPTPKTAAQTIGALPDLVNIAGAKRYAGTDTNNYVQFNGETWRIIGVYDDKLKIMRDNLFSDIIHYHDDYNDTVTWEGSTIQTYLENIYYPTLSVSAKEMIYEQGIWNIGVDSYYSVATDSYTNSQSTQWVGKIGLLSTYEYLYSTDDDRCYNVGGIDWYQLDSDLDCTTTTWMNSAISSNISQWLINNPEDSFSALMIESDYYRVSGIIVNGIAGGDGEDATARPVVYLKSDVMITGGTGASGDEYILSYNAN